VSEAKIKAELETLGQGSVEGNLSADDDKPKSAR
jgi:hypothetical protein|tara:strand:+ start:139 stop:240 length:102 start_codon:yes stop_codon:yes gene_type:complete